MNWDALKRENFETVVPSGVGFTFNEYAAKFGLSRGVSRGQIDAMLHSRQIKYIGVRAGTGHPKVYDVIRKGANA